jgi:hypothetical protein
MITAAVATTLAVLPGLAEAKPPKRVTVKAVTVSSADSVRANAADPGGDYRRFPDWARAAFGSGRSISGR